jgi:hypothetical protein
VQRRIILGTVVTYLQGVLQTHRVLPLKQQVETSTYSQLRIYVGNYVDASRSSRQ